MKTVWSIATALLAFEVVAGLLAADGSSLDTFTQTWVHTTIISMGALLCWWRAARERAGRAAWTTFGAAIAAFAVGEAISSIHGADDLPIPSVADFFWLLWYPFAIAGIALLMRDQVPRFELHRWVDGLAIVLLVAIPGVGLVLEPILEESPQSGAAEVLAFLYPLADLMLIGAVLGVLPLHNWRPGRVWLILGAGLLLVGVGDTVSSVQYAQDGYQPGLVDPFWSGGVLLIALAAWQSAPPPDRVPEIVGWKAVVLPVSVQALAVAIQIYAYGHELPESERILTIAVLVLAMVQIIVSRPRAQRAPPDG